jgi:hypothetical protein
MLVFDLELLEIENEAEEERERAREAVKKASTPSVTP